MQKCEKLTAGDNSTSRENSSLSGKTRPVKGTLAMAILARKTGKRGIIVPRESADEAALVEGVEVYPVDSLDETVRFLNGERRSRPIPAEEAFFKKSDRDQRIDFAEVKGQQAVRRAVEIAVSGGHNLLMIGNPGSGKSMIAKRIPTIMPEPQIDEFLEILSIQSAAGSTLDKENSILSAPHFEPRTTPSAMSACSAEGRYPAPERSRSPTTASSSGRIARV